MLRAQSSVVGPWERYSLGGSGYPDGTWALRSPASSLYVYTELGFGGDRYAMLRAAAWPIGSTARFNLYSDGTAYFLQSAANGLYVSAELGYTGSLYAMLRARASVIGSWERWGLPNVFAAGRVAQAAALPAGIAEEPAVCPGGIPCTRLLPPNPSMSGRNPG